MKQENGKKNQTKAGFRVHILSKFLLLFLFSLMLGVNSKPFTEFNQDSFYQYDYQSNSTWRSTIFLDVVANSEVELSWNSNVSILINVSQEGFTFEKSSEMDKLLYGQIINPLETKTSEVIVLIIKTTSRLNITTSNTIEELLISDQQSDEPFDPAPSGRTRITIKLNRSFSANFRNIFNEIITIGLLVLIIQLAQYKSLNFNYSRSIKNRKDSSKSYVTQVNLKSLIKPIESHKISFLDIIRNTFHRYKFFPIFSMIILLNLIFGSYLEWPLDTSISKYDQLAVLRSQKVNFTSLIIEIIIALIFIPLNKEQSVHELTYPFSRKRLWMANHLLIVVVLIFKNVIVSLFLFYFRYNKFLGIRYSVFKLIPVMVYLLLISQMVIFILQFVLYTLDNFISSITIFLILYTSIQFLEIVNPINQPMVNIAQENFSNWLMLSLFVIISGFLSFLSFEWRYAR